MVLCCEHALNHILIRAVRGERRERRANKRRPDGVFAFEDAAHIVPKASFRLQAAREKLPISRLIERFGHALPAAWNCMQQRPDGKSKRSKHDTSLDDIGPNDRLDAAKGGVEGRQSRDRSQRENVDPDLLPNVKGLSGHHFIAHHEDDGRNVEARSACESACDQEDRRCGVLRPYPEAQQKVLVDRDDAKVVIRLDEYVGDDDAREDGPQCKLCVGEIALFVAFTRSAKKCRRANLRGKDRGQDGPPGNVPITDRKALEALASTALVEPDGDDHGEIKEDNGPVNQQAGCRI